MSNLQPDDGRDGDLIAGVELGGTKCVCVLGDAEGNLVAQTRIPTTTPAETLGEIENQLTEWRAATGFTRLGIASFGPLDLDLHSPGWGRITATAKPGWSHQDVARRLASKLHVPVALETDVVGAALAEGLWGAARGLDDFAYVTVGTGVGVGIIAGGKPLGGFGHAELGHIRVVRSSRDTWPGSCPFHGDCVEGLASGTAIVARTGTAAELLAKDDPVWRLVADALAGMLQTLVLTATPRLILMGGGVMSGNPGLMQSVRDRLPVALGGYIAAGPLNDMSTFLVAPSLGTDAGPLGAIAVALRIEASL